MRSSSRPALHQARPKAPVIASAAAVIAIGIAVAVGFSVVAEADRDDRSSHVYTGELSSMNLPVIETPGAVSGRAEAAGVVVEGSSWALGDVPLDTAVVPRWVLRNEGTDTVILGEPHPEVRAGCCPGPITLSGHVLEPGEVATLDFELAMHVGMDGWHDLAVHVPITTADAGTTLELAVTGDFGGR
jgi:hypothetical protein